MAQIDADERDYVSLAALRDGNGDRSPEPGAGNPAIWPARLCADRPGRRAGDARLGKVTAMALQIIYRGRERVPPSSPSLRSDPRCVAPPACRGHFPGS